MAWEYSGWLLKTGQEKLDELKRHIQEVADAMTEVQSISFDGTSYARSNGLQAYLASLQAKLIEEEARGRRHIVRVRLGD